MPAAYWDGRPIREPPISPAGDLARSVGIVPSPGFALLCIKRICRAIISHGWRALVAIAGSHRRRRPVDFRVVKRCRRFREITRSTDFRGDVAGDAWRLACVVDDLSTKEAGVCVGCDSFVRNLLCQQLRGGKPRLQVDGRRAPGKTWWPWSDRPRQGSV
ncbi:hypothetical protein BC567DRAFT_217291 [Phyllosticta citribraziliensis]